MPSIDQAILKAQQGAEPLIPAGARVLVAVSGGPDSLCLLHALSRPPEPFSIAGVCAAHVEHGLRGDDSQADADFVTRFCDERGIPCLVRHLDIAAEAARDNQSIQLAAREARYRFLEEAADAFSCDLIATAHTANDQEETVLLNILRGTGLTGLKGIPERRGRIVRPLLGVSRADIEAYCAAHGLEPRRDASNADPSHYLRNRIRLELLPMLERDYHPGIRASLTRLSVLSQRDDDYLSREAQALFEAMREPAGEDIRLDRETVASLHPAIASRVVRLAFEEVRGTTDGLLEKHVEKTLQLAAGTARECVTTAAPECIAQAVGGSLVFAGPVRPAGSITRTVSHFAKGIEVPGAPDLALSLPASFANALSARVDADATDTESVSARNWEPGDRIDPLGMGGRTKKLQDIFSDAKIPRDERRHWPVVCDSRGPLWVPGLVLAERAKITPATTTVLRLFAVLPYEAPKKDASPPSS
jgi:tRNA(Ile)-lysidine synthase